MSQRGEVAQQGQDSDDDDDDPNDLPGAGVDRQ
jgi:hypothetical protein